jgi:Domain of unknown function (DUF1816)
MNEIWVSVLETVGLAWWVEIITSSPNCTYYFGPFASAQEAETARPGYVQDLEGEGAQGLQVVVKRCKPTQLTIFDDGSEKNPQIRRVSTAFSNQS